MRSAAQGLLAQRLAGKKRAGPEALLFKRRDPVSPKRWIYRCLDGDDAALCASGLLPRPRPQQVRQMAVLTDAAVLPYCFFLVIIFGNKIPI